MLLPPLASNHCGATSPLALLEAGSIPATLAAPRVHLTGEAPLRCHPTLRPPRRDSTPPPARAAPAAAIHTRPQSDTNPSQPHSSLPRAAPRSQPARHTDRVPLVPVRPPPVSVLPQSVRGAIGRGPALPAEPVRPMRSCEHPAANRAAASGPAMPGLPSLPASAPAAACPAGSPLRTTPAAPAHLPHWRCIPR